MRPRALKPLILFVLLISTGSIAHGNDAAWTWMGGPSIHNNATGIYGTQGVAAPGNRPGMRQMAATWTDATGKFWLFGGSGTDGFGQFGALSDLWTYNPTTSLWTWVKGSNRASQVGVYGTKGVESPANTPGCRYCCASWIDSAGRLWLFGGCGYAFTSSSGYCNDLWRFDPTTGNWTWLSGTKSVDQYGVYGTQDVAASTNYPGAKGYASCWTDRSGKMWLFGGKGKGRAWAISQYLNDLWCYDPATGYWTWVKGGNMPGQSAVRGTQGVADPANTPGPHYGALTWTDALGKLWILGGIADSYSNYSDNLSPCYDLWNFDPDTGNWTWISGGYGSKKPVPGTQGVAAADNFPGSRYDSVTWTDSSGRLWLFGGEGVNASGTSSCCFNDLWFLDPTSGLWTWVKGDPTQGSFGNYDLLGAPDPASIPASRDDAAGWMGRDGRLWIFGGYGNLLNPYYLYRFNDLWSFEPASNNWTWHGGGIYPKTQPPVYEIKGPVTTCTTPGTRTGAGAWTDATGGGWLFGGFDHRIYSDWQLDPTDDLRNDLWRLDLATGVWKWVKGSKASNQPGVYGTRGVPAPENTPGARTEAQTWSTPDGRLWLYGGNGYGASVTTQTGIMADLWRYDPPSANWTWVRGDTDTSHAAIFGAQGISDTANTPGSRTGAVTWTDPSGKLWLFGGRNPNMGLYNDLWRYDPATDCWTWVKGSNRPYQNSYPRYPRSGDTSLQCTPGSREKAVGWVDAFGCLWLYGGAGYDSYTGSIECADLWKFNPATNTWTFIKGQTTTQSWSDSYGTQGIESSSSFPIFRENAVTWRDRHGLLWLFGGYFSGYYNDLWCFDPATGNWTWIAGSKNTNQNGNYGTAGVPAVNNMPGGRSNALAWHDGAGQTWLYGGWGYDAQDGSLALADLWRLSPIALQPAPVILTHPAPLTRDPGTAASFSVITSGTQPLTYQWYQGNYALTQGSRYSGVTSPTLTINPVYMFDAGYYSCRVTNSRGGTVTSNAARLTVNPTLTVSSAHGSPTPSPGNHAFTSETLVTARMNGSPDVDSTGTTRYLCTGWKGTGAAPAKGSAMATSFTLGKDSTLQWQWQTQYQLAAPVSPVGGGRMMLADGVTDADPTWFDAGTTVTVRAIAAPGYIFSNWTGDASGTVTSASLVMNRPRQATANFIQLPAITAQPAAQTVKPGDQVSFTVSASGTPQLNYSWRCNGVDLADGGRLSGSATPGLTINSVQFADAGAYSCVVSNAGGSTMSLAARLVVNPTLTVVSDHGSPSPAVGITACTSGTLITASVSAVELDSTGTTRWLCTGWQAVGATPASGSGTSLTLTLNQPITLTWQWQKQYWVATTIAPADAGAVTLADGTTPAVGWYDAGQTFNVRAMAASGQRFAYWFGDLLGHADSMSLLLNAPKAIGAHFTDRSNAVVGWRDYP